MPPIPLSRTPIGAWSDTARMILHIAPEGDRFRNQPDSPLSERPSPSAYTTQIKTGCGVLPDSIGRGTRRFTLQLTIAIDER
jgi:hypothetical protein